MISVSVRDVIASIDQLFSDPTNRESDLQAVSDHARNYAEALRAELEDDRAYDEEDDYWYDDDDDEEDDEYEDFDWGEDDEDEDDWND